jgi:uncharacterized protein
VEQAVVGGSAGGPSPSNLSGIKVGLGYRRPLHNDILNNSAQIDFLEVISDQFMYSREDQVSPLLSLADKFPLIPHSIGLSVGTASPIDESYVTRLAKLIEKLNPPWHSDHLCLTRVPEADVEQLTPLWRTWEALDVVCDNIATIQSLIPRPLLLENITYYFDLPAGDLTEVEFLNAVLQRSRCDLLLDVNNVYTNSINLNFNATSFLESISLDRVKQIHLAGGEWNGTLLIDTHSRSVPDRVWELLQFVLSRCRPEAISLEWDSDFPPFSTILAQLERVRRIVSDCKHD